MYIFMLIVITLRRWFVGLMIQYRPWCGDAVIFD